MNDETMAQREKQGVVIAAAIIGGWGVNLAALLTAGTTGLPPALWLPAIAVQTFLHTGLFITAHDAMHGTVAPANRRLNDRIGRLAVRLYALFSFAKLEEKHWEHHDRPASDDDPDHHDGGADRFWPWYFGFIGEYIGFWQIAGMALVYNVLLHLVGVEAMTLNLFWVLPSLLSTLQLFYFGTYLPHRRPDEGFADEHRATTNDYSTLVSFLTCYHFGYHHEHHLHPGLPWWRLPRVREQ